MGDNLLETEINFLWLSYSDSAFGLSHIHILRKSKSPPCRTKRDKGGAS
jgi:hypothetical protein